MVGVKSLLGDVCLSCASIMHPPGRLGLTSGGIGLPELSNAPAQRPASVWPLEALTRRARLRLAVQPLAGLVVGPPLLRRKVPYPL